MTWPSEDDFFGSLSAPSPIPDGTRIRLTKVGGTENDPCPPEVGDEGTVMGGNGSQVHVDWDKGSRLFLLPGVDEWEVIGED